MRRTDWRSAFVFSGERWAEIGDRAMAARERGMKKMAA